MDKPKVGEILLRAGLIDELQLRAALGDQRTFGHPLGTTLVRMGALEERDLVRALAQQLQLPVVELEGKRVQPEVLALVPAEFAEQHLCVPLFLREKGGVETLHVAMDDPSNVGVIDELAFRTGLRVQPVMVPPSELVEAIDRFYRRGEAGSGEPVGAQEAGAGGTPQPGGSVFGEVAATAQPLDEAPAPAGGGDRTILRALCYLLIEKGVISKDELQGLVNRLVEEEEG